MPGVVHWGLEVVLPRVHDICEGLLSFGRRIILLSRPGFFDTREAGIEAGSRACFFFSFSSFGSARDGWCPVVSGSLREMSLQVLLKVEGLAIT